MSEWDWQTGRIAAMDSGRRARVVLDGAIACRRCLHGRGCGAGVFARLFRSASTELSLSVPRETTVGDRVRIGIPARSLALAAALLYGLPLLAFVAAAAIGQWLAGDSAPADVLALAAGLLAGAGMLHAIGRRPAMRLNPTVVPCSSKPND